jgi:hypothetical protein
MRKLANRSAASKNRSERLHGTIELDGVVFRTCVYRKPKPRGSGDDIRRGWGTSLCFRPTDPDEQPARLCPMTDAF